MSERKRPRTYPHLSFALLIVSCAGTAFAEQAKVLQEIPLARIAVGPNPLVNIVYEPSEECCDPEAGIGAVSETGSVYFFDIGSRNIKRVGPSGFKVISADVERGNLAGMAVGGGVIYLLFDGHTGYDRYAVFAQSEGDTAWVRLPLLDTVPREPLAGVPVLASASVYCGPDGTLYVYDHLETRSYPIGTRDNVLSAREQVDRAFEGMIGHHGACYTPLDPGVRFQDTGEDYDIYGNLLGVDRVGHLYVNLFRDSGSVLQMYDRSGQLLAEGPRPRRTSARRLENYVVLDPTGGVIEFQAREEELLVTRWALPL